MTKITKDEALKLLDRLCMTGIDSSLVNEEEYELMKEFIRNPEATKGIIVLADKIIKCSKCENYICNGQYIFENGECINCYRKNTSGKWILRDNRSLTKIAADIWVCVEYMTREQLLAVEPIFQLFKKNNERG